MSGFNFEYAQLEALRRPTYFFSKKLLKKQYLKLRDTVPCQFGIFYSLKANANFAVVQFLNELGVMADVASQGELKIAQACGFASHEIEFTGPGKDSFFIEAAVKSQIFGLIVESVQELERVEAFCSSNQTRARIAMRVASNEYFQTSGRKQMNALTQFGIDKDSWSEFFTVLAQCKNIDFVGFHAFSQSQILKSSLLVENFLFHLAVIRDASEKSRAKIEFVNLGGGFGIPYYLGDQALDMKSLKNGLGELANRVEKDAMFTGTRFYVEAGRYITGPAGVYIARVEYTKKSRDKKIAVLNGGLSHHLAACGFGQAIRRNFIISAIQKRASSKTEKVNLVGPSCFTLDVIAQDIELPILEPGDFICVHNSGAYGAAFSPNHFLQFEPADEILLDDL